MSQPAFMSLAFIEVPALSLQPIFFPFHTFLSLGLGEDMGWQEQTHNVSLSAQGNQEDWLVVEAKRGQSLQGSRNTVKNTWRHRSTEHPGLEEIRIMESSIPAHWYQ